ncbi:MAG: hypothetical protein AAFO69_17465 [Bacteroidota bacterium]
MLALLFNLSSVILTTIPNPPATPIDGGTGLLLAAGIAYGLKKLRDQKDEK